MFGDDDGGDHGGWLAGWLAGRAGDTLSVMGCTWPCHSLLLHAAATNETTAATTGDSDEFIDFRQQPS